jgi:hypothetical protein
MPLGGGDSQTLGKIGAGAHLPFPFSGPPPTDPCHTDPSISSRTSPLPTPSPERPDGQTVPAICERWGGAKPRALQGLEKGGYASQEFPPFRSLKGVDTYMPGRRGLTPSPISLPIMTEKAHLSFLPHFSCPPSLGKSGE